jgi:hypothetical protein
MKYEELSSGPWRLWLPRNEQSLLEAVYDWRTLGAGPMTWDQAAWVLHRWQGDAAGRPVEVDLYDAIHETRTVAEPLRRRLASVGLAPHLSIDPDAGLRWTQRGG